MTKEIEKKLLDNGRRQEPVRGTDKEVDFKPVGKLFTPDANCTWLLTEIDPEEPDIAFGLCDLGVGSPEIGNVSLAELSAVKGRIGLPIERDRWFSTDKPLSILAKEARAVGRIVE